MWDRLLHEARGALTRITRMTSWDRTERPDEFWKRFLDAKTQREAAQQAVTLAGFTTAGGAKLGKGATGPITTELRKRLNTHLRETKKQDEKNRAAKAKLNQLVREADEKARAEFRAAHTVAMAALPQGAKVTQATSSDETRPQLRCAWLVHLKAGWALVASDSYRLAVVPLQVGDAKAAGLRPDYPIPPEALKEIEKGGAFRIDKDGTVIPLKVDTVHKTVRRPFVKGEERTNPHSPDATRYVGTEEVPVLQSEGTGYKPSTSLVDNPALSAAVIEGGKIKRYGKTQTIAAKDAIVPPEPPASRRVEVTLDAQMLAKLASALGAGAGRGAKALTLTLDAKALAKADDGSRVYGGRPALRVTPPEAKDGRYGILMPINKNAASH